MSQATGMMFTILLLLNALMISVIYMALRFVPIMYFPLLDRRVFLKSLLIICGGALVLMPYVLTYIFERFLTDESAGSGINIGFLGTLTIEVLLAFTIALRKRPDL